MLGEAPRRRRGGRHAAKGGVNVDNALEKSRLANKPKDHGAKTETNEEVNHALAASLANPKIPRIPDEFIYVCLPSVQVLMQKTLLDIFLLTLTDIHI